ncbi:MAG: transcriptional repressor [Spirochaetales bacterium]|nr:transcriptional repressor [Spirochaetales bacterium]
MIIHEDELEKRLGLFQKALRDRGIKLTHQRLEIFREIASRIDHPDAEAVYRSVKTRLPTVSLDTVYRTLHLLMDLGLIGTLGDRFTSTRFDPNLKPHHHFLCVRCGLARDFESSELDNLDLPEAAEGFGKVIDNNVVVRGICNDCMRAAETVKPR